MVTSELITFSWEDFIQEPECDWPFKYEYFLKCENGTIYDLEVEIPDFLT